MDNGSAKLGEWEHHVGLRALPNPRSADLHRRIAELEAALRRRAAEVSEANESLARLHASPEWRLVLRFREIRDRWFPSTSRRRAIAARVCAAAAKAYKARRLCHTHMLVLSWRVFRRRGWRALMVELMAKVRPGWAYRRWIAAHEPSTVELEQQRRHRFVREPRISIVVPTFNTPRPYLQAMLDSVIEQTYPHWQLCIADGNSQDAAVKPLLEEYARRDPRIQVAFLAANEGIAGNSNAALALATGEYVALLDHDDTLAPCALFEIARAVNDSPDADFLYSDEDKIDENGQQRLHHHFKPDWSPDLLRSQNYITHLAVFRRDLLRRIGGFRPGFDGSQDYDLILRATERARRIVHIPHVLYHWRIHAQSCAEGDVPVKWYAIEAGKRALEDHLSRQGTAGEVRHGPVPGTYRITYSLKDRPTVSLIADCGLRIADAHSAIEVIVAGSGARAAACNAAAAQAVGEYLLFLDAALVPLHADWLERMMEHTRRPEVGAVGAKIYAPNGTVDHAGLLGGVAGPAGQAHRHFAASAPGYGCRLICTQNLSAVSGACLMIRRALFAEVGGFDEQFKRAYYDVDLCLRLRKRGYLIVWTPQAELRRSGVWPCWSASRRQDRQRLADKWQEWLQAGDPYYNRNLSTDWEDFSLDLPS